MNTRTYTRNKLKTQLLPHNPTDAKSNPDFFQKAFQWSFQPDGKLVLADAMLYTFDSVFIKNQGKVFTYIMGEKVSNYVVFCGECRRFRDVRKKKHRKQSHAERRDPLNTLFWSYKKDYQKLSMHARSLKGCISFEKLHKTSEQCFGSQTFFKDLHRFFYVAVVSKHQIQK